VVPRLSVSRSGSGRDEDPRGGVSSPAAARD